MANTTCQVVATFSMLAGISWPVHAICCRASVGFLKNPVHGSMVGRQISVESDSAASTVRRSLVADHEKVRILLNPYKKTSRLLARWALNVPQESATEPANSHRLLADVEGAGTMQPTTGAAAPTMAKDYSLPSGTIGH